MTLRGFQQERDGLRRDCSNFVAESGCELRIIEKEVDCPESLIVDSLSGSVAAGKQFKVLIRIIRAYAVDVVDSFFGAKQSSEFLFHSISMLEYFSRRLAIHSGDGEAKVAMSRGMRNRDAVGVCDLHTDSFVQAATLRPAEHFALVDIAARTLEDRDGFSALNTFDVPVFVFESSTLSAAFSRAVHRVFTPRFLVRAKFARVLLEWLTAFLAYEAYRFGRFVRAAVDFFVRSVAGASAKFSGQVASLIDGKNFAALNASERCGHALLPFECGQYQHWHNRSAVATANLGVA